MALYFCIRNVLKTWCFWELYLPCLGQWLHLPVVLCILSQKMQGQFFGSKFGNFLLPQSCINQIKLSNCNIIKYLRKLLCTVLCQRVSASSVFSGYHMCHFWIAKETPHAKRAHPYVTVLTH